MDKQLDRSLVAAALFGRKVQPLENDYNPLEAGIIGAGRSVDNALGQVQAAYHSARRNLGDAFGSPQTIAEQQAQLAQLRQERAENDRFYEPLTRAYPYSTAAGEALPAIIGGPQALHAVASSNLAKRSMEVSKREIEQETSPEAESVRAILARLLSAFPR